MFMRPRHALLLPACLLALTGRAYAGPAAFGDVRVGWTSPPQVITVGVLANSTRMFTIENIGTDVLHIQDFRLVDPMQCVCFQVNNAPMPDMNGAWPSILPGGRINL